MKEKGGKRCEGRRLGICGLRASEVRCQTETSGGVTMTNRIAGGGGIVLGIIAERNDHREYS